MIVQEAFVSINTKPDVVERYLTEPGLMAQWRSPLVTFEPIEGNLMALGSTHRMAITTLFFTGATYTVAERDGGHILLKMDGVFRGADLWRWWADGPRTLVQNRVEYEVTNELMRPFVAGFGFLLAQLDMNVQLARLQQIIEGRDRQKAPAQIPAQQA